MCVGAGCTLNWGKLQLPSGCCAGVHPHLLLRQKEPELSGLQVLLEQVSVVAYENIDRKSVV